LDIWSGHDVTAQAAQRALVHRAKCSRAARQGEYSGVMDSI
jgi:fructose-bisphosphate aldolase class I